MPVAPAAHYHMGGVATDFDGRTSLEGLWAVGEVASTGVHGANRLASNSLLEAAIFGGRIADALRSSELPKALKAAPPEDRLDLDPKPAPVAAMLKLRAAMSGGCALIRSEESLNRTIEAISALHGDESGMTSGLKSALITAELIAQGALMREESRGAHFRTDYPEASEEAFHTEIAADSDADEEEWELVQ